MPFPMTPAGFFLWALIQAGFLFLLLFGIAAAFRRRGFCAVFSLSAALALYGAVATALFWLAWVMLPERNVADVVRWIAFSAGVGAAIIAVIRGQWRDEIVPPLLFCFFATLVLLVWVHWGQDPGEVLRVSGQFWRQPPLPSDNAIPIFFANALSVGEIPHPMVGDWLSSDRPPLQTAIFLTTPGFLIFDARDYIYQPAGIGMQMFALLGTWCLARAFTQDRVIILCILLAVFFTPLVLVNGAYVWPKLLAAAFILPVAALHFSPLYEKFKNSPSTDVLAGALIGGLSALAMLAHGASAFALLGLALAAIILRRFGTVRYMTGILVIFAVLYGPWLAYQKFADPPGNRLLKMHLAGSISIDSRSTLEAITDSYAAKSWAELGAIRKANIGVVFSGIAAVAAETTKSLFYSFTGQAKAAANALQDVRNRQFQGFVIGCGLIGLSLFLLPLGLWKNSSRPLTLAILCTLCVWVLLMFDKGTTITHQGSYFPQLALIAGCLLITARQSRQAACVLAGLQVGLTLYQYIL